MDEQLFVPTASNTPPPPPSPMPDRSPNPAVQTPPPPPPVTASPPPSPQPLPPITPQSQTAAAKPAGPVMPPRGSSPLKPLLIILLVLLVIGGIGYGVYTFMQKRVADQVKTITYWGLWEPESAIRPIFEEYERTHPKIKIDYKVNTLKEYRERLSSALSQGKGPDIFRIHSAWVPMFKANLSPVPASVFSAASYESTFYPAVRDTLRSGANYIAVPLMYDGLAMYINDSLFQETGLPVPQTWDELRKAATIITRCQTDDGTCKAGSTILISGAALGDTANVDHWQDIIAVLMLQNRVLLSNPVGQPASDVITYYANFEKLYNMWNSSLPNSTTQFAAGKVGFYFGPSWRVFDIKAANPNLKFSVHPIPQLPIDPDRGERAVNWASYWVEGVNSKSANTTEAWELMKYLSSSDVMQKLYQLEVQSGREFGEPYSRVDLSDQIKDNQYLGPYVSQAPLARTWYLTSFADDGANGIVTKISQAYADVVNQRGSVEGLPRQINTILSSYGLSPATP